MSHFHFPMVAIALTALMAGCAATPTSEMAAEQANISAPANEGILIIGGTGQLGSYHVNQLSEASEQVTVLARSTSTFERLEGSTYDVVIADLTDTEALKAAVMTTKPAVIIDASNLPGIRLDDGDSFYWRYMRALVEAAQAADVTQIIRHSGRGARLILTQPTAMPRTEPRVVNYMRDLARAEIALETGAAHADFEYTLILNASLTPEPAAPAGTGTLSDDITIDTTMTRSDLARITQPCILNPACYGQTFNAVGGR